MLLSLRYALNILPCLQVHGCEIITAVSGFLPHRQKQAVFLFFSTSTPALGSTKPTAENVQGFFPRDKITGA